jgi:tetratricopeptide (TPR) repeat protein
MLLLYELRWEESLKQIEKALELDPLSPVFNNGLANFYLDKRDYDKALSLYKRAIELGVSGAHEVIAHVYGRLKMYAYMRREFAAYVELEQGSSPYARTRADFDAAYYENDGQTCSRLLPELETYFGKEMGPSAFEVAVACFSAGENDKGFEWLERSYSMGEGYLPYIRFYLQLDGVRTDPRYLDLLKRLGLD